MKDGRIQMPIMAHTKEDQEESDENEEESTLIESKNKKIKETNQPKQDKEIPKKIQVHSFDQYKEELALIATNLMESPEKNIKELKTLRDLGNSQKNTTLKQISLLTQLAVYKDIIPGYRIRKSSEKEEKVKLSKEVKQQKSFEETLLSNYQEYLKILEDCIQSEEYSLVYISVQCMTELIMTVTHFNFTMNLLQATLNLLCQGTTDSTLVGMIYKCICTVFKQDESGQISLEIIKFISQLIKSKSYKVPKEALDCFLSLRLCSELVLTNKEKQVMHESKKRKQKGESFVSKKARKVLKVDEELQKELKEAEAVYDKEERRKWVSIRIQK